MMSFIKDMTVITRAYFQCCDGHFFSGGKCPIDGWYSSESQRLQKALARLHTTGQPITLDNLRMWGLSEAALSRTIIVEFGTAETAVDVLRPFNPQRFDEPEPTWL
jgi:hypothetical protein